MTAKAARGYALLCLAAAAAVFCLPVTNPDLWWHLSAARWMAEHRALPSADWLSWTMQGQPWVDFEWLTQVVWYALFKAGGQPALWALKAAAFGACAALVWSALGLYGTGPAGRALGVLAWALGTITANDLRPELASLVAFLWLWRWLESRRLKKPVRVPVGGLVAFFALWANLHGGFPYGLALLGVFAAGEAWRRRSYGLLAALAACAAAPLLNPYGTKVYSILVEHASLRGDLQEFIREWSGGDVLDPFLLPFWAVLLVSFGAVLARHVKTRDLPFEHLAVLLVCGLAASSHVRTGIYFVSAAIPIAAAAFARLRPGRPAARMGAAAALLLAYAAFVFSRFPPVPFDPPYRYGYVPPGAADFLEREKAALSPLRMFNLWGWGGYLGWRLHPDYKVFVDGRYIFHPLLRPMQEALTDPPKLRRFLDERGMGLAVVDRDRKMVVTYADTGSGAPSPLLRPAYLFLFPRPDWGLVYWDEMSLVFARRTAAPKGWVEAREFTLLRPEDAYATALRLRGGFSDKARMRAEIDRYASWAEPRRVEEARVWLEGLR